VCEVLFKAEDCIRDSYTSRRLGDVYKILVFLQTEDAIQDFLLSRGLEDMKKRQPFQNGPNSPCPGSHFLSPEKKKKKKLFFENCVSYTH
ncbi:hypothetical protein, partial [Escherichia coli]|uniref:hypothetical protein n=1 Tax=Escherichia coli TaxID=562 RepID=UPI002B24E1CF